MSPADTLAWLIVAVAVLVGGGVMLYCFCTAVWHFWNNDRSWFFKSAALVTFACAVLWAAIHITTRGPI